MSNRKPWSRGGWRSFWSGDVDPLLRVSAPHKLHATRAFAMQQAASWATVVSLFVAHQQSPIQPAQMVWRWVIGFLLSWVLRMIAFVPLYRLTPTELERSVALKTIPLLSGLIGSAFWIWTIVLFTGPVLTMREMIMCVGLLSISVSMTGMWPVTPVTSLGTYVLTWSTFSFALWHHGLVSPFPLLALNVSVALILWLSIFVSTLQVEAQIAHGIELDEALARLRETNETLEGLKDAAYEALHTRSQLFTEASHDFQRRLQAAKLWVIWVTEAVQGCEPAQRPLARMVYELDSLHIDVNNILDFARTESMNAPAHLRATSLQDVFQRLESNFERATAVDGKQLRIRPSPEVIGTDAAMLSRMIENIVSNALKFTRKRVLVCARRRGDFLSIEVWDQGPGIRDEARSRIFKAFHRESDADPVNVEANRRQGVGLGLAIALRLATQLSYSIRVDSTMGKGSVFRIRVPVEFLTVSSDVQRAKSGGRP